MLNESLTPNEINVEGLVTVRERVTQNCFRNLNEGKPSLQAKTKVRETFSSLLGKSQAQTHTRCW